ncbi:MAG: hypothetical protein MAG431_01870 [Chloroflexi bacterium]|nr:hypothetical protein [Chloroflexota bacterium]
MGKYERGVIRKEDKRQEGTHPIWRGIGCIMIILILAMSYAGASLLVDENKVQKWVPVPKEIQGGPAWGAWAADLYTELFLAFFLALIGFGLFVIIYSIIFKASSPKDKTNYY